MKQTVLILGPTGRFGRHASQAFEAAGWSVRRFDRKTDSLRSAAHGAAVIVNAWNPPYDKWAAEVPGMNRAIQDVARANGATVMIPGNVYVFGKGNGGVWTDATPHAAVNPLGRVRIAMEESYRDSGVQTVVLRAGDFLDTEASGNWFDRILTAKLQQGVFTYPGQADIPRAWAFLPDLARATVALAEMRESLPRYADIPFPGYRLSGAEMQRLLPVPSRLRRMAWWPLVLAAPFWRVGRGIVEMRYLWDMAHSLDETAFRSLLPDFRETPVEEALRVACAPVLLPDGASGPVHGVV